MVGVWGRLEVVGCRVWGVQLGDVGGHVDVEEEVALDGGHVRQAGRVPRPCFHALV